MVGWAASPSNGADESAVAAGATPASVRADTGSHNRGPDYTSSATSQVSTLMAPRAVGRQINRAGGSLEALHRMREQPGRPALILRLGQGHVLDAGFKVLAVGVNHAAHRLVTEHELEVNAIGPARSVSAGLR